MAELPKYVQNANKVIQILATQPDRTWRRTQRELAEALGLSLPELSTLVKTLLEQQRVRRGHPLNNVRGRTYTLELADDTPLASPVRREALRSDDRPLDPHEAVTMPIDLASLTMEQIGYAVMRTMRRAWDNEERISQIRTENLARAREYRDAMITEQAAATRIREENEALHRRLAEQEAEMVRMRTEINALLTRVNTRTGGGTFKVKDMLDEDGLAMLSQLMQSKPGYYKESDAEVGLAS